MRTVRRLCFALATSLLWSACASDPAPLDDGGSSDSGAVDARAPDGGTTDAGSGADSGAADSGASDSGAADSGASDSGAADSGASDGGNQAGTPLLERQPRLSKSCTITRALTNHRPRFFDRNAAVVASSAAFFVARGEHMGTPFGGEPSTFLLSTLALDGTFGAGTDLGGTTPTTAMEPAMVQTTDGFAMLWIQDDRFRFARFDPSGAQRGTTRTLQSPVVVAGARPKLLVRPGGFLVVYTADARTNGVASHVDLLFLDDTGAPTGAPRRTIDSFEYFDPAPSAIVTSSGIVLMYRNNQTAQAPSPHILAQRLDAAGTKIGAPTTLTTVSGMGYAAGGGGMFSSPRVAITEVDGGFVAAWSEAFTRDPFGQPVGWSRVMVQRLDSELRPLGPAERVQREVDDVNAEEPALYTRDGKVILMWSQGAEIYFCGGCFPDNSLHLIWLDPADLTPISAELVVPPLSGGLVGHQLVSRGDDHLVLTDIQFHVHEEPGSLAVRCQ